MKQFTSLSRVPQAALAALILGAVLLPSSSSPAQADQPLPSINLPIEGWTVVALKKGFLQEEYNKLGTKVNLVDPGTTQLIGAESALLDRGGLAIAQRMIYPATVHKANGIDASIVWLSTKSSEYRTPVLALKSSGLNSIADLKDKNFGSSRVACGWTSPTEIFTAAGLPLDNARERGQVRYTNISNTVATSAALLSGRIDATSTHVALPDVAALIETDEVKVIGRSPADGVYVNNAGRVAYFVMREFVDAHPQAIVAFLRAREKTDAWINANVDEAAAIIAKETRIPVAIARFGITDPSSFQYMQGEPSSQVAVDAIKTFQKWYIDHGDDILSSRHLSDDTIESFVDKRFFKGGEYSVYQD
ncbi:MAG: ABC transporter substrate-binding protein [Xanthobacteraceae bacterium]|nr:ABC transporter substrate-binding protein [Xanthobacteraceae bacterium]MBV9632620.1 ABC transporter substrate-binding protein [Xanthobacteraceae bacterium]